MIRDVYFRHGLRASMLPRETAMHKWPEFHTVQVYRRSAKSSAGACVLNCRVWNGALTIHPNNEDTHPARSEREKSAASMHFEKVRRAKASSNRRTGYWYAVPSRENLRKTHVMRCYLNVKVLVLKSTDATSPRDESAPGSVPAKSSRTDSCRVLCWWAWDLVSGRVLHLSCAPQIVAEKATLRLACWDSFYRSFNKQFA